MSEEDRDMELLTSRAGNVKDSMEEHDGYSFDFGLNFEWDKELPVVDVSVSFVNWFLLFCFYSNKHSSLSCRDHLGCVKRLMKTQKHFRMAHWIFH